MAKLVQMYQEKYNVKPFDFVGRVNGIIEESGNKALFVLTPLNTSLLKWYAAQGHRNFIPLFDTIHASLINYLDRNKIRYLDLYDGPDEDCFVDAIHTNTCGNVFVATRIADYVTTTGLMK
jgi:lysophospholipase L1-like esterase